MENQTFDDMCSPIDYKYGCKKIPQLESVFLTDLGGFTICGKRGGKSFLESYRPKADGRCPSS